ncbi:MAG: hypothetical protein RL518_1006 [Pseudomonadota bacterium]|jgi:hypothetical protein
MNPKSKTISLLLALTVAVGGEAAAQTKYTLKKTQLATVANKQLCGLIKNKWTPVKKSGKKYVLDSKNKSRCKTLLAPTSLKKSGIASIPSASQMLKARASVTKSDVLGVPPLLTEIPTLGAKNVFWSAGFIDALAATSSPTQEQCQEFFHGAQDGQSSGMLGCFSVQGVGYSFQSILEGTASACLMKGLPTKANLSGGAVTIVEGSLPNNDITQIFSTPSGSGDRLVKIQLNQPGGGGGGGGGNQNAFIKIHADKKLQSKGLQYSYSLWFCQDGETTPNGYEETTVSLAGEFKAKNVRAQGGSEFQNEISAFLTKAGASVTFDLTKARTAKSSAELAGANFRALVTVSPDNTISTKVKESFNGFGRSNYGIASFSGSGLADFRVRSAAIKDAFFNQTRQAGLEYRTPIYVSAPGMSLVDELANVDLATDPFYTEDTSVTPDFSDKSCSADPDVTLSMDFSNPLLIQVFMTCANERLNNMDFCRSAEMFQVQSKCNPL